MGVELHIVRASGPISIEEWEQTVERRTDLKFQTEDLVAINPATGERITIPPRRGSTLLLVNGEWLPSFYWSRGEISFKAVAPAQHVGMELAAALGAEIVTDDREPLGPATFSITPRWLWLGRRAKRLAAGGLRGAGRAGGALANSSAT